MNTLALIIGAIMMVMGLDWYRRSPVSAGRPASLLMLMGALGIIAALLSGCPAHADNNPFQPVLRCEKHQCEDGAGRTHVRKAAIN